MFAELKIGFIFATLFQKRKAGFTEIKFGRLAQSVQSIWFTPRGSGVRIPHRPRKEGQRELSFFCIQKI